MRKLVATLLMLIMLTPSLACAMPICAGEAATKTAAKPCAADTKDHGSQPSETGKKLSLLKDCMGVDLQVADGISIHKPDLQDVVIFMQTLNRDRPVSGPDNKTDGIRGPPPDWPSIKSFQPSLILSTQRFRI